MHVEVWLLDLVELASYSDVLLERDWSVFLKSLFLGCLAKCSSILVVRVFFGNRCIWLIYEWNFCCKKGMFRKWLRCFFSRWNRALNVSIDIHYANSSLSWFRIMKIEAFLRSVGSAILHLICCNDFSLQFGVSLRKSKL